MKSTAHRKTFHNLTFPRITTADVSNNVVFVTVKRRSILEPPSPSLGKKTDDDLRKV